MASETSALVMDFFTNFIGDVPPELEGLVYVIACIFLFYAVDAFFILFRSIFEVRGWTR